MWIKTRVISASPMKELGNDSYLSRAGILDSEVTIPCIVNYEEITCGTEIVLMWEKKADNIKEGQQTRNNKRVINAYSAGAPKFQKKSKIVFPRCLVEKCRMTGVIRL